MEKIKINADRKIGFIDRHIYGQFAEHLGRCIYEGLYVGEDSDIPNTNGMRNDVINVLKELDIPVLRWPGGCFADDYHWRDGIGPKEERPYMVNTNWGGVVENNHFGTHEFFELCEQLGTEAYICGNVGSGSVREMRDWVEYITFDGDSPLANERRKNGREKPWKLKYFGVGNENWGCGGNMRPEYYCDLYRRYRTFIRDYGEEPIFKIAGGPNKDDTEWMETLLKNIANCTDGISLHSYSYEGTDWDNKGDSVSFDNDGWYRNMASAMTMDSIIKTHTSLMDAYDPEGRVKLMVDEWGNWFEVMPGTNPGFLYQQNTLRDAVSGMLILHIFHKYCDRVSMANIAQMVNVLQAMVLTEGERMCLTPTYYLFKMMKPHMDSDKLDIDYNTAFYKTDDVDIPEVSVSATSKNGAVCVSLANTLIGTDKDIELDLSGMKISEACAEALTGAITAHNTFDEPDAVKPQALDARIDGNTVKITLPANSIAVVNIK